MEAITTQYQEHELSEENFEKYLEDCMFIQFFNSFLSLQIFPHRLLYNAVTNHFEEFVCAIAEDADNPPLQSRTTSTKNEMWTQKGYYLKTLDKEDGIHWIKQYRLPFFLRSEIYADFKLATFLTSYQTNLFHKFLRPELNFLHDLVKKTSSTKGIRKDETDVTISSENSTDEVSCNEPNVFSCNDPTEWSTNNQITCKNEDKINFSEIPSNIYEEVNKMNFLNGYITSTPLLREKILRQRSFHKSRNNGMTMGLGEKLREKELFQHRKETVDVLLKQLYRNVKLQEIADNINEESDLFISDYHQRTNDILLVVDALKRNVNSNVSELPNVQFQKLLNIAELWPINLSYKKGIDAFKEFLHETSGESNLLFWLKVEVAKHFNRQERKSTLQDMKEKFFRSDSPHYIPKQSLKAWGIELRSNITMEELISAQKNILNPLLTYWCPRFTLHLYREKLQHEKGGKKMGWTEDQLYYNLPQRPLSCMSHSKDENLVNRSIKGYGSGTGTASTDIFDDSCNGITKENRINSAFFSVQSFHDTNNGMSRESRRMVSERSSVDISERSSVDIFDGMSTGSNGITKQTRRAKSAHPRVLTTPNTRNTNASYKQLLFTSLPAKEGYGYKRLPIKYYHNDASDVNHRKSVRLYVAPIPAHDASASTISQKRNFCHEEVEGNCDRCHLDSLVDVLLHERHTGNYFLKFLEDENNKLWLDCYLLWKSLQDYNEYFLSNSFAPAAVKRKSNFIYSKFIISNGEHDIQCCPSLQSNIFQQLDPPYEDLFDKAEEHVLICLLRPYSALLLREKRQYDELKPKKHLKYIEVPPSLKKNFLPTEEEELEIPKILEEHSRDKDKINPETVEQTPQYADGFNFETLLHSKSEMEHFRAFLELNHKQGISDLKAWTDFEVFRILPHGKHDEVESARDKKAMENREKWLGKNYFFGPHSPASKAGQKKVLEVAGKVQFLPERPSTPVSIEAQKYIRARLERKWLILFKASTEYQERMKSEENTNKMVEDLLMQKQLRRGVNSNKFMKLSHVAFSSSKLAALRMTISDPRECELFRKFIKVRGVLMENNLDFWLEVQKYKDLCHNHVGESLIKQKIQAIIDVYIKSSVPPEVQINVSADIAERLYEKACGRSPQHSPYIFREAQTTVIRVMFDSWNEYIARRQKFADQLKLSESLKTLEVQYQAESTKRKMMIERKRLWTLLTDKNKQEIQKEVDVSKVQELLHIVQKNREIEESGDTTSFLYSKYLAEGDLNQLEARMREHGILEFDKISSKKSTNSNLTPKFPNDTSRRTSSALKDKGSSELSDNGMFLNPLMITKDKSSYGGRSLGSSAGTARRKSQFRRKSSAKKSDNLSSVSDLHFVKNNNLETLKEYKEEMEENSSRLTRKSLEEFEKTPEGKQLTIPLPIVRIQTSNVRDQTENEKSERLPVITESEKLPQKKRKKQKIVVNRPLPRNAGTASLIAKLERESPLVDSPPPEINAVVVVC